MVAHAIFREYPHLLLAKVWQALNDKEAAAHSGGGGSGMLMKGDVEDGLNKEVQIDKIKTKYS